MGLIQAPSYSLKSVGYGRITNPPELTVFRPASFLEQRVVENSEPVAKRDALVSDVESSVSTYRHFAMRYRNPWTASRLFQEPI
jgi:hypothetical protein